MSAVLNDVAERLRERARVYRRKGLSAFADQLEAEALDAERMALFGKTVDRLEHRRIAKADAPSARPPASSAERWISVNQACAAVGVSRRTIYNWIGAGKLQVRHTAGGAPRILEGSLWRQA